MQRILFYLKLLFIYWTFLRIYIFVLFTCELFLIKLKVKKKYCIIEFCNLEENLNLQFSSTFSSILAEDEELNTMCLIMHFLFYMLK